MNISPGQTPNNNNIQQQKTFNPNPNPGNGQNIKSSNTFDNNTNGVGYSFSSNYNNNNQFNGPVFPRNINGVAGNPITQDFTHPISYSFSSGGLYDK